MPPKKRVKKQADSSSAVNKETVAACVPKNLPPRRNGAVGLPNKSGADCFWLSVLQCMRHTPGFSDCLRRSLLAPRITRQLRRQQKTEGEEPILPKRMSEAMRKLMDAMDATQELHALRPTNGPLVEFRASICEDLTGGLVDPRLRNQSQEDVHEFLLNVIQAMDNRGPGVVAASARGEEPPSTRGTRATRSVLQAQEAAQEAAALRAKEPEPPVSREQLLLKLAAAQAWADHTAAAEILRSVEPGRKLFRSALVPPSEVENPMSIFEGQRCCVMRCSGCSRPAVATTVPFITEEVNIGRLSELAAAAQTERGPAPEVDDSGVKKMGRPKKQENMVLPSIELHALLAAGGSRAGELLEDYKCNMVNIMGEVCGKSNTTTRTELLFLLPEVYIIHVNRTVMSVPSSPTCPAVGERRIGNPVNFPEVLDLKKAGLLLAPESPLDRNMQPCCTLYELYGVCFHRGTSARCGHYVTFARLAGTDDGAGKEVWVELNDSRVIVAGPSGPFDYEKTPGSGKAVLLWYKRRDGSGVREGLG